jgi:hypothetical protein
MRRSFDEPTSAGSEFRHMGRSRHRTSSGIRRAGLIGGDVFPTSAVAVAVKIREERIDKPFGSLAVEIIAGAADDPRADPEADLP